MLERVWRKGNPLTLLVGMSIGTATMENSIEVPQKKKKKKRRVAIRSCHPTSQHISRKKLIGKDKCTPVFTVALFTTLRHGNNLNVYRQMNKED